MYCIKRFFSVAILTCSFHFCFSQTKEKQPEINANTYLYWASNYHQKRIFDTAYYCYKMAAKIDPANEPAIIPLLDDLERWDEIISITEPLIKKGDKDPMHLGPLYTAHFKKGDSVKAEKIIKILIETKYDNEWTTDYKNYILSYYHLWKGQVDLSLNLLEKIKDDDIKTYAGKEPKFKALFDNKRFQKITTVKTK